MPKNKDAEKYTVLLPSKGRAKKKLDLFYKRKQKQLKKAIKKLSTSPTNFRLKGLEKLKNVGLGEYTMRVFKGDRIFYDVDLKKKKVYIRHAGKHDHYKYLQ